MTWDVLVQPEEAMSMSHMLELVVAAAAPAVDVAAIAMLMAVDVAMAILEVPMSILIWVEYSICCDVLRNDSAENARCWAGPRG
jgi:hypothetical protein